MMSDLLNRAEALCASVSETPLYVVVNDLIGGYAVSPYNKPSSEHATKYGEHWIVEFPTLQCAASFIGFRTLLPKVCAEARRLRDHIVELEKEIMTLRDVLKRG